MPRIPKERFRNKLRACAVAVTLDVLEASGKSAPQKQIDRAYLQTVKSSFDSDELMDHINRYLLRELHDAQRCFHRKTSDGVIYRPIGKAKVLREGAAGTQEVIEVVDLLFGPIRTIKQSHEQVAIAIEKDLIAHNSTVTVSNRHIVRRGGKPYRVDPNRFAKAARQVRLGKPADDEQME